MLKILIRSKSGRIIEEFSPLIMRFLSSEDAPADSLYAGLSGAEKRQIFFHAVPNLTEMHCSAVLSTS